MPDETYICGGCHDEKPWDECQPCHTDEGRMVLCQDCRDDRGDEPVYADGGVISEMAEQAARATQEQLEKELIGAWRAGYDWLHLYKELPGAFVHKPLSESVTLTYRVLPTDSPRPPRPDELHYIRSYDLRDVERPMVELARHERTVGDSDE